MNDPSRAINVNLSSLLSLKAELLRKQAEVSKAKITRTTTEEYQANVVSTHSGNSGEEKRNKKHRTKEVKKQDDAIVYEHEDSAMLEKSQKVLQAKSKYYERMSRTGGSLNSDENCLVMFNRKRQEDKNNPTTNNLSEKCANSSSDSSDDDDFDDDAQEAADDWVEYTDCLGRTRKCLRQDLEEAKRRDAELAASMPERLDQSKANWMIDTKGSRAESDDDEDDCPIGPMPVESLFGDGCSMVSKIDEQRANWERKEQENYDKSEVHYQDVFFDEARQHGVGYYAFSTDEEERKRQQDELEKTRQETIAEQEHQDTLRTQREKIIAERVLAAKNRQRARLGLPPLEANEELKANGKEEGDDKPKETKKERKERKRAEKIKRRQEEAEKERELERQKHIRPWDKEKDGVKSANSGIGNEAEKEPEWMYKPERQPMSQQEWNEHKRDERNPDFAPVPEIIMKRTNFTSMPPPPPPAFATTKLYNMVPPPPIPDLTFNSFQSSRREKHFQRRNYELQNDTSSSNTEEDDNSRRGAAIPPPTNLDADRTLPPNAKRAKSDIELERSIEAGLRFLRDNADKGTMSTKSSWTAKADY